MAYATTSDIQSRISRTLSDAELAVCSSLLDDAAVIIDTFNADASADAKRLVSCNMVIRAVGNGDIQVPIGSTQGTVSALGYSQTWTMGSGSTGEMYLSKLDKKLLGIAGNIGASNPLEDLCEREI